jgi:hypothetical protein
MEIGTSHWAVLGSDEPARQRLRGRTRRPVRHNYVPSVLFAAALLVSTWAASAQSMSAVTTRSEDVVGRDYGRAGDDEYWEQPRVADFPAAEMQGAYDGTKAAASRAFEGLQKFVTQTPAPPSEEPHHYGRQ